MAQSSGAGKSVNPVIINGTASSYLAPEYLSALKGNKASVAFNNEKCDVFSLGMIIF